MDASGACEVDTEPRDPWQDRMEELMEEVNALKLQIAENSRGRYSTTEADRHNTAYNSKLINHRPQATLRRTHSPMRAAAHHSDRTPQQRYTESTPTAQRWQQRPNASQQEDRHYSRRTEKYSPDGMQERRSATQSVGIRCWNCGELGHGFRDCRKAQNTLFCYRCGQKGYASRSCPACHAKQGNFKSWNQL